MRVRGTTSQNRQTDLGIPQGGVLSVTRFLVTIYGILGELGNVVDESLFADDLAIYITKRNQRVVIRTLQTTTNKIDT